jgi:hypothetical protein
VFLSTLAYLSYQLNSTSSSIKPYDDVGIYLLAPAEHAMGV